MSTGTLPMAWLALQYFSFDCVIVDTSVSRCWRAVTDAGRQLIRCGELEQKLGEARQDFIAAASRDFLRPLRTFLDGDMKTVQVS